MKLIADSGSTKTDWYAVSDKEHKNYVSQGFNPYFWTSEEIKKTLEIELLPQLNPQEVKEIYFYGAGCANEVTQGIMRNAITPLFPQAMLSLGDDLLAAARATAGHDEGICCILGTGSNSCYYDGKEIANKIPSLGYILGDEGAGVHLGKKLIRAYFYQEMPKDLMAQMEQTFDMDKHLIITTMMESKTPNRYLASFSLFASENQTHPFIQKLVQENFEDFLNCHILKYEKTKKLPIHFVGSVAFGFKDLLLETLKKYHLQAGKIIQSPFPSLLEYFFLIEN